MSKVKPVKADTEQYLSESKNTKILKVHFSKQFPSFYDSSIYFYLS